MKLSLIARLGAAPLAGSLILGACGGGSGPSGPPLSLEERIFQGNEADFARQQQLIQECMVAQGFEYTPRDNRGQTGGRPQDVDERSEEYVSEYGFGISTLFGGEIRLTSSADDPNQQYRNGLSEAQKSAYDKALYGQDFGGGGFTVSGGGPVIGIPVSGGPAIGGADMGDGEAQRLTPGGCLGEALKATGADRPFDSGLFDDLQELEDRIEADPRIVDGMKKWSACMAEAGYDYRDIDEARTQIREEFAEVTGLDIAGDGGAFVITSRADAAPGSGPESGKAFDPLANADPEKLEALRAKERRVALATLECFETHLASTEEKVRAEFEEEFLKEHPGLVDD